MKALTWRAASIVLVALAVASLPAHAKTCRKGIPCGNSCISASKTCRIGGYSPPTQRRAPSRATPHVIIPPPISAPKKPSESRKSAPVNGIPLHAWPSEDAPISGYYAPGDPLDVYGSAGNWILISPLDAPKHKWMLQHGAK